MDFKTRLKELRRQNGMIQQQLGDRIDKTKGTISAYETGVLMPSFEVIKELADVFNVSVDYLIGRTDTKFNTIKDNSIVKINIATSAKLNAPQYTDYKKVYAGNLNDKEYFYVRVDDNSMSSANIPADSLVLIEKPNYINNDIVCAIFEDEIYIRKYSEKNNMIVLDASNSDTIIEKSHKINVLGKVVKIEIEL